MLGVAEKPRLSVFRSHKHIRAQLIDDVAGRVISSASSFGVDEKTEKPVDAAHGSKEGKSSKTGETGDATQVSGKTGDATQVSKENPGSVPRFSKGVQTAYLVGTAIAKKAKEAGIETCVFDRGRYRYHGRIKALAEGARKEGLRF